MPLTHTAIRHAKPGAKPYRLYDSAGLYLEISPAGGKWWRFKYRFAGKEKRLAPGRRLGLCRGLCLAFRGGADPGLCSDCRRAPVGAAVL